jgi:hypothetical protein
MGGTALSREHPTPAQLEASYFFRNYSRPFFEATRARYITAMSPPMSIVHMYMACCEGGEGRRGATVRPHSGKEPPT